MGPSPRARGIPRALRPLSCARGSIPASAGNPENLVTACRHCKVHPRERGESRRAETTLRYVHGPSPRARGIRHGGSVQTTALRSIPASAGNPTARGRSVSRSGVHPRERGESATELCSVHSARGPSPRARGIRRRRRRRSSNVRSIPASAGNPFASDLAGRARAVHPRERGESVGRLLSLLHQPGPSPRARGIPFRHAVAPVDGRSIPASAGNPGQRRNCRRPRRVHPRERGESVDHADQLTDCVGPSPRARGIRVEVSGTMGARRSIPASAGNPDQHMATPPA